MSTVLIPGGTGLIGSHLCKKLVESGYDVAVLSRTGNRIIPDVRVYNWQPDKNEIEQEAIETADYIINLSGANIGEKRWSVLRKKMILDSRVETTKLIYRKVKEYKKDLKAYVSASATGYYGSLTTNEIYKENSPPANDFLGNTCRLWEQSADRFSELGIRTVKIRTGVVLTHKGGALSKMILPVKLGIGSAIGSGNQYMPWIHIDDLCNIYIKSIEDNDMLGAYNAVSPDHKTNEEFTMILSRILKRPFWFPKVPAFVMKILFGEMSELLLEGSRVSAEKIKSAGYKFIFPNLESALGDIFGAKK